MKTAKETRKYLTDELAMIREDLNDYRTALSVIHEVRGKLSVNESTRMMTVLRNEINELVCKRDLIKGALNN